MNSPRAEGAAVLANARENALRFGWLLPRLLAGCRRPDSEHDYELMRRQGVRTLVSLLEISGLPHFASRYDFKFVHIPIDDGCPPNLVQLEQFVSLVRQEPPVCVHCLAGIGRTGCMLTGYLIRAEGLDPFDAIKQVERSRVYAFQTAEQEDWLYTLQPRKL